MINLKCVSRNEYIAAVQAAGDTIRPHVTEGYSLSVTQWVDVESDCPRFQVVYNEITSEQSAVVAYYIEEV